VTAPSAGSRSPTAVVLLDIEGTTTPVAFVYETLFPFARERVGAFLRAHADDPEIQAIVADLRAEMADADFSSPESATASREPRVASPDAIVSYVDWLMDRDRKSRPLKALQGRIWEDGYASGALAGDVYPDVATAFARWTARGLRLAIFSSGSVLAQRLLFGHSRAGDLTPYLSAYFDTAVGAKGDAASYRRIAAALATPPSAILFISDVAAELDAARAAGFDTRLCVRPPAHLPASAAHLVVESFAALEP
jgi:enolase-phosphatase E1